MGSDRSKLQWVGIVLLWVLTVWETFTMGVAGLIKFTSPEVWGPWFDTWGYPAGFMSLVGGIELVGAILLLVPATAAYAAGVLIVVMLGALVTVVTMESGQFTPPPILMHLVGLSILLWFRRPVWSRTPSR